MSAKSSIPFLRSSSLAWCIGLACVCAAASGRAVGEIYTPPPFSHYQPILDRMPFGSLPANFNAAVVDPATIKNEAQVKAEQQALAKKINMSAVNVTPDGQTAIGFTDLSVNPPVNYYLLVGAVAGGWTVINADYDEETATIEKEGVTITLKLGKGLVDSAATPAKAVAGHGLVPATAEAAAKFELFRKRERGTPAGLTRASGIPSPLPALPAAEPPSAPPRSYAERQLERASQQTAAQKAAEERQQALLLKLASKAADDVLKKREEAAAQAEAAQAEDQQLQQVLQSQQEAQPPPVQAP